MQAHPLQNADFVARMVDLANAGVMIIQLRSYERERVRDLAVALTKHPDACHEMTKAYSWCMTAPAFNIASTAR